MITIGSSRASAFYLTRAAMILGLLLLDVQATRLLGGGTDPQSTTSEPVGRRAQPTRPDVVPSGQDDPPGGGSNCCFANGGLGCDNPSCQAAVCAVDAFCCDVSWDGICAGEAANLCPGLCGAAPTGACCLGPGNCQMLTFDDCSANGGSYQGDATSCAGNPCGGGQPNCPAPGSCCIAHGNPGCDNAACCTTVCNLDSFCCTTSWDGICANEAAQNCPGLCVQPPNGACCFGQSCQELPASDCGSQGGMYQGDGTVCSDGLCAPPTFGACCLPPGNVCQVSTPGECAASGGNYLGDGTFCHAGQCAGGAACPSPGSCCVPHPSPGCDDVNCCNGVCSIDAFCCNTAWDSVCVDEAQAICGPLCAATGACCLPGGNCQILTAFDCGNAGGNFLGEGAPCSPTACQIPPSQPCDDCGPGPHWIHNPSCPPGPDNIASGALVGIDTDLDCVRDQNLVLFGPVNVNRSGAMDDSNNFPGTRPVDGHLDVLDTEMVSMSLSGGGVTLTAGAGMGALPLAATRGAIAELPGDPLLADSFFDVFFEVDLGGGNRLYNQTALRVDAPAIDCVPPNSIYFHPTGICIPLYTSPIPGQGVHVANLVSANHDTYPLPGACCLPSGQCIQTTSVECGGQNGTFQGENTPCTPTTCVVPPDYWTTWRDVPNTPPSYQTVTLPAGFFGPGCAAVSTDVEFAGQPLSQTTTGDADTCVQRVADPVGADDAVGTTGTTQIQITALNLTAVAPITVMCNGVPQQWDVQASLSPTAPPMGTLTATKTHANGGTFDSTLFVQPLLTFTRVDSNTGCSCADYDLDAMITLRDFASAQNCFGSMNPSASCSGDSFNCTDLNSDGLRNLEDHAIFAGLLGQPATSSPPDCLGGGSMTITLDSAGTMAPILFTANNVPFVHTVNPNLDVIVDPVANFNPGIVETQPGNPSSQTTTVVTEEAQLARHVICRPRCSVDLDIDSNNNMGVNPPARSFIEEILENFPPSKYICLNDDDDDNNHVRDLSEEPIKANPPENDPVPMIMELRPNTPPGQWKLTYNAKVQVYNVDVVPFVIIPSGMMFPCPLMPNPKLVKVEGVQVSAMLGDAVMTLEYDCDGDNVFERSDTVLATVIKADLDVDSDNTNNTPDFGPQRNAAEDDIEDRDDLPGKVLCVNNDDDDTDNVVDFGDGYNLDGMSGNPMQVADNANAMEDDFVKMVFEIPAPVNLGVAKVKVTYSASDPATATINNTPPGRHPSDGRLRIWAKNGNVVRKKEKISAMPAGDYVAPGEYKASDFGLTNAMRTVDLWLEGIRPSPATGGDRILFEVDPDGAGPAGFQCADAVLVTVCQIQILDATGAVADFADVGHWGADAGAGLNGYTAANNLVNGAGGTFIDTDPDRFVIRVTHAPANTNPAVAQTIQASIATLLPDGTVDDPNDTLDLLETGANTGVFASEALLLMSPDLPAADNPDDLHPVHSVRAGATVMDGFNNDRTHRATIDGRVRATYNTPTGGMCRLSVPVCDRVPMDTRRTVTFRVHVLNEPFMDTGYDHDANAATPNIGAGNGMFDFNDTGPANGMHDAGEASEPFTDISGDGARNTVLGPQAAATAFVNGEIGRCDIGWAQGCIKYTQMGAISFEEAPSVGGVNIIADGAFNINPAADDVTVITNTAGAVVNVAEVFFVPPMAGASGYARVPANMGAALPAAMQENTYLFVGTNAVVRRRTLTHEFGHALTNRPDNAVPVHVYFPSLDGATLDNAVNQQRRLTHATETNARTCRAAGALGAVGNRLLPGCP